MAIDTMDHFYVKMKCSEHEHNSQLSYPDHSGYHNVKLHYNLQLFYVFNTLCDINCCIKYFVREGFDYLCDF